MEIRDGLPGLHEELSWHVALSVHASAGCPVVHFGCDSSCGSVLPGPAVFVKMLGRVMFFEEVRLRVFAFPQRAILRATCPEDTVIFAGFGMSVQEGSEGLASFTVDHCTVGKADHRLTLLLPGVELLAYVTYLGCCYLLCSVVR